MSSPRKPLSSETGDRPPMAVALAAPPTLKQRAAALVSDRRFDLTVLFLIVASISLLVAEMTLRDIEPCETFCVIAGEFITLLFIVELSLRAWVAPRLDRFLQKYWLDILSILPLLRVFRAFRVFRLMRLVRLFRAAGVLGREYGSMSGLLRQGIAEYAIVGFSVLFVLLFGTLALLHFEGGATRNGINTMEDAFWWTIYWMLSGEPMLGLPTTTMGRIVAVGITLAGLTLTATFTGIVSALMIERIRRSGEAQPMDLEDLKDHIVICGWDRAAPVLIENLQSDPKESRRAIVVLAGLDAPPVFDSRRVRGERIYFLKGDFTRIDMLRAARIETAAKAVLLPEKAPGLTDQGRDARTLLAALTIERLNPGIHTCAALLTNEAEDHLRLIGVEEVVLPDETEASMLATATIHRGLVNMMNELVSPRHGNWIEKRPIPAAWTGKPFVDLAAWIKRERNELLLGVEIAIGQKGRGDVLLNPPADRAGAADDLLICLVSVKSRSELPWPG